MTTSKTNIRIGNDSVSTRSFRYDVTWYAWKRDLMADQKSVIARAKFAKDALSAVGLRTSIFVGSGVNLYTDIIPQAGIRQNTRKLY
jgi:hypothetical protein